MKRRRKLLFGGFFLFIIFVILFLVQRYHRQNEIVAVVNGQEILYKDVQRIYSQLDDEESVQIVLESLIDEMIVVSNADKLGVEITSAEMNSVISEYRTSLPDVYKEGIRIYGKKDFYEGVKLQLLYDSIYNIVVEEMLENNKEELKERFYNQIKTENDISSETSQDEIFEEYYSEFKEYIFDDWLKEERENADIKIYNNMEDIK